MGRSNDPRHRLTKEKGRIKELPETDAEAVLEFLRALDADDLTHQYKENGMTDTKAVSTLEAYGRALRLTTKELEEDLLSTTADEYNQQFSTWKKGKLADKTIKQRQSAVIKFLKYHRETAETDPEDVVMVKIEADDTIDPDDIFTSDEMAAMREACSNARDRCILDLLAYTGQRIRAIQTLRLKDVDPDSGASGRYRLNTDELGLKGADKNGERRPLLGAQKSVREWIRMHPTGEEDDYLITALAGSNRPGSVEKGDYLGRDAFRRRLIKIADKAGVDKDVNPHAFRHFFVTTCKRDYDMDSDDIKFLIGHDTSSRVMETTYQHLTDEDHNLSAEESWDYEVDSGDSPLTPPTCRTCDEPLPGDAKACPGCGAVYTPDAQAVEDQIQSEMKESYKQVDPEDGEAIDKVDQLDELLDDPEVKAYLLERMEE